MKWQNLLTKKQLAHMRWSGNGVAPTLWAFKKLRIFQKKQEAEANKKGFTLNYIACHECNDIERKLKERLL